MAKADVSGAETHQRSLAWAYSAPILAIAAALIFGLIYDITQTALEAWIWVVVRALVAAGIIAGTLFSRACSISSAEGPCGIRFCCIRGTIARSCVVHRLHGGGHWHVAWIRGDCDQCSAVAALAVAERVHGRCDGDVTGRPAR